MADDMTPLSGGAHSEHDLARLEDELGRLAREITADDLRLEAPPLDLWSAIEAEVGESARVGEDRGWGAGDELSDHDDGPNVTRIRTSRIGAARGLEMLPRTPVPPRPGDLRSRSGLYGIPAALAVAAVLALVLATGAALVVRTTGADQVVAQADIVNDELPVPVDGAGTAILKQHGDDQFLELELPDLAEIDAGSVYEVWMIDTDVVGMISLGNLSTDGDTARIDLPDNIDHTRFPVVDISVEPLDGDPTHSGQSVLRGVLTDVAEA